MIRRHLFGLKESFRGGLDRVCSQKARYSRAGYSITKWMMEYTKIGGASASPSTWLFTPCMWIEIPSGPLAFEGLKERQDLLLSTQELLRAGVRE